jgi:hypothetical protein
MAHEINPPPSDELIVRHAFYSKVSSEITSNIKDIDNIANNLREFVTDFDAIKDEVKATETRNKTIITIAAVIWTVIGGSVGLYIQKGLEGFDKQTQRISTIENNLEKHILDYENYKNNTKRDFDDVKNHLVK